MTTPTESAAAPAEVTFQVTVRRAAPGSSGTFSLVISGLLASDQAIEFIETARDAALADGVAVAAADAAADPTVPASDLSLPLSPDGTPSSPADVSAPGEPL